jgi:hypothetical protein
MGRGLGGELLLFPLRFSVVTKFGVMTEGKCPGAPRGHEYASLIQGAQNLRF